MKKSFISMITSGEIYLYNGIFAFAKRSNFLRFVLETLRLSYSNIKKYNQLWISVKTGPIFITSMFVSAVLIFISMFSFLAAKRSSTSALFSLSVHPSPKLNFSLFAQFMTAYDNL